MKKLFLMLSILISINGFASVDIIIKPERTTTLWNSVNQGLENTVLCVWQRSKTKKTRMELKYCYFRTNAATLISGYFFGRIKIISRGKISYDFVTADVFMGEEIIGVWRKGRPTKIINYGINLNRANVTIDEVNSEIIID